MKNRTTWIAIAVVIFGTLVFSLQKGTESQSRNARLADQIRCPTCAGLAVSESNSPLATVSRDEINRRVAEGQTDEEIRSYFVSRYGETALMSPKRSGATLIAWLAPVLFAVAAGVGIAYTVRRWKSRPLPPEEPTLDLTEIAEPAAPVIDLTPAQPSVEPAGPGTTLVQIEPEVKIEAAPVANEPRRLVDEPVTTTKNAKPLIGVVAVVFAAIAVFALTRSTEPVQSETPQAMMLVAQQQLTDNKPQDAVKTYAEILKKDPDNVEALTYQGWLFRLARMPEGEQSIDRAIQINPNYPDARVFKGIILLRDRNQPEAAVKEIEAFQASNPPAQFAALADQVLQDAKTQIAAR